MFNTALLSLAILASPAPQKIKPATNTVDPVCKMTVDAKASTVAVRGQEYRVCSKHCGAAMQKDPDKYLEQDGTPKTAKKK